MTDGDLVNDLENDSVETLVFQILAARTDVSLRPTQSPSGALAGNIAPLDTSDLQTLDSLARRPWR